GTRHQMPVGQSGRTLSGKIGASTRSPRNIEISAKVPLRDFYAISAKLPTGLDCGELFYGSHWGLLGQLLVVASGAPFIPPCRLVPHSLTQRLATGTRTCCLWSG